MKLIARLLIPVLLFMLCSCAPRGESKSLDEVLQLAQTRFSAVKTNASAGSKTALDEVASSMQGLLHAADDTGRAKESAEIASLLQTLLPKASYTSRPAIRELIKQYQASGEKGSLGAPAGKLMVARTYNMLASELETRAFDRG